jgi:mono/diheme cytochrome c family protein
VLRLVVRVFKYLSLLLFVAIAGLSVYVSRNWDRTWDVPEPDLHATTDPAVIARGEYLALGPAHCIDCHVGSVEEYERFAQGTGRPAMAGGFPLVLGPLGTVYTKNITPDPETGIGRYTDPQIARMLRHGVRPDGISSIPLLMPFSDMSDDDIVAVLSFLRAQEPVRREVPENEWSLFGKVMRSFIAAARPKMDGQPPRMAPPQEATAARGAYLAQSVADCGGCHTPFNQMTGAITGPRYSGGNLMEPAARQGVDLTLWFAPPNITPLKGSALTKFPDRETFVARFRFGGRKYDGSPMPWEAFARMTPEDIGALYEFLHSLPPSGEPAPEEPTVKQ